MASQFTVSIIVGLKDQASAGLRGLTGSIQSHAATFRQVGASMTAGGTMITAALIGAAREGALFDDVLADVEIQSGATAEEMAAITEACKAEDFVRLGLGATDVAEAYKRLAAEGYDVVKMQEMLGPITDASIALGVEQGETTRIMLNLMEQFRLESSDMTRVADTLAGALAGTSFQGQELAETMKYAGMAGAALNWSLEETIAVTDRVIKTTGEASMAGTYFRGMVDKLMAPTKRMVDEFDAVAITMDEVTEAMKDPVALIELLTTAEQRGANITAMFGSRAGAAARSLIGQADAVRELIPQINRQGFAAEAAAKKAEEGMGPWREITAQLKNFAIEVGVPVREALAEVLPMLTDFIGRASDFVKTDFGKASLKWALGIGVLCQAFGPLVYILPTVAGALGGIVKAGPGIVGFFGKLPGLVTGTVSALTALGPGLLAAAPYIALAAGVALLAYEFWELWKSAQATSAAIAECKLKTEEYAALVGKTAELEAVTPTMGEIVKGWVTPGATGRELAQQRWMAEQAGMAAAPGETAAARRSLGLPAAQGPGVGRPEVTVPVNVYIGNEQLDERQRRVAVGVVREAVAGAR